MEVLVLDGKNYVKASKAARDLGYATDYVGQLCRSGKVDAHLIGRTWYVNPDVLGTHRVEKKRNARVKAREQARKSIEEAQQKKGLNTKNNYRNIVIQYEEDHRELIPETRKLSVASVPYRGQKQIEDTPPLEIENKGEKIRMSGDLTVIDVTDGPLEPDTVFLTPSKIRKGVQDQPNDMHVADIEESDAVVLEDVEPDTAMDNTKDSSIRTFEEKLADLQGEGAIEGAATGEVVVTEVSLDKNSDSNTAQWVITTVLILLYTVFVLSSTLFSVTIRYSTLYPNQIDTTITLSPEEVIEFLRSKI